MSADNDVIWPENKGAAAGSIASTRLVPTSMYGCRGDKPVQLTAIVLPDDTPVTNGSALPLKVH